MVFVKVVKNKAYFKRFQVKYRRRREGKTDYRARKRLITQDKNKYESPKYRFVVRFTNTQVICQVVYALVDGDRILVAASSKELSRYGLPVGLKNYAAAYATGLLCARRLLSKLGLHETYKGNTEITGKIVSTQDEDGNKYFVGELNADKRPFRAFLDIGIKSSTTGARVFGAMKGAVDGGLDIPHSDKRFPGFSKETKKYKPAEHRNRILGKHVADYMKTLLEEDSAKYAKLFGAYVKAGITGENLEALYVKVHAAIRANPSPAPKKDGKFDAKFAKKSKLTLSQRKDKVKQKKAAFAKKVAAK